MKTRIKELREEKGLTQKQLAEKIGFNQSNIARWESEKQEPSASAIVAMTKFFDVSAGYLLGLED